MPAKGNLEVEFGADHRRLCKRTRPGRSFGIVSELVLPPLVANAELVLRLRSAERGADAVRQHLGLHGWDPVRDCGDLVVPEGYRRVYWTAGIVTFDGQTMRAELGMGLVADVFNEEKLGRLPGDTAIGHVRYSTAGNSDIASAQPLLFDSHRGPLALGHNGNLVNVEELRAELLDDGVRLGSGSDSEVIAALVARDPAPLPEAVANAMRRLEGAYSATALSQGTLVAFRDPHGFRPLAMGQLELDGRTCPVFASETCAFDLIGATYLNDVEPGEIPTLPALDELVLLIHRTRGSLFHGVNRRPVNIQGIE